MAPFPSYFGLPDGLEVEPMRSFSAAFGREELRFRQGEDRSMTTVTVEGPIWRFPLKPGPAARTEEGLLASFRAKLEPLGWTLASSRPPYVLSRSRDGKDAWLHLEILSPQDVRLLLLEKGVIERTLTLHPPAAEPVPWKAGDVPEYLAPYPGGRLIESRVNEKTGFEVTQPGDAERTWVGDPVLALRFEMPDDLSAIEFDRVFCPALERAGWTLLQHRPLSITGGDMVVRAHYGKDGRDLWLYGHLQHELSIQVADTGLAAQANRLKETLDRDGHIALYGIYFDYDQDTLKPASEATLKEILALLTADPKLGLRIEGHTDSTGTRSHNQALSERRAGSVKVWLVQHGVAASRLTFAGFADSKPVADNKTPEGRSKNRRVELVKR